MQSTSRFVPVGLVLAMSGWCCGEILDPVSSEMTFQARLTDGFGQPIADGPHELDFFIYNAAVGGAPLASVLNVNVITSNGVTSVRLGSIDPAVFDGSSRWMGMTVDDNDDDPFGDELTPRIPFGAVPHAYRVDRVENAELTDDIELGDSATAGSMSVFAGIGAAAATFDGADRALRLFDQAGIERVTILGDDGFTRVGSMSIETPAGTAPLAVQRENTDTTDLLINNQGRVAIGEPAGTLAKLTVNSAGEEPFRVRIDGVTQFSVAPDGQVGVGTSTPVARLQVNGASTDDIMEVRRFGTTAPSFRIKDSGEVIVGDEEGSSAQLTVNGVEGADPMRVRTDGVTTLMVARDGQVGVGTSVPSAKLQVNGTSGEDVLEVRPFGTTRPSLRVTEAGDVLVGAESGVSAKLTVNADSEDAFRVRTDGTTRFMVGQDGQVGVGTSTPTARFQINGAVGEIPFEVRPAGTNDPSLRVGSGGNLIVGEITGASAQLTVNAHGGDDAMRIRTDQTTRILVDENGNMGIGTTNPSSRLHIVGPDNNGVTGPLRITSGSQNIIIDGNEIDAVDTGLFLNNNSNQDIILAQFGGSVGIGTNDIPADTLLAIDGKVMCEEVEVQLSQDWPDYVFAEDYPLLSIEDLEQQIARNKHLPGIPPAADVQSSGVKLGEMQVKTIEKVEELTLYVIQLNNRLKRLEQENSVLRSQVAGGTDQ